MVEREIGRKKGGGESETDQWVGSLVGETVCAMLNVEK